ncbi:membrane dipeptidase [Lentzea sp. NPDC004782]|uniref:membrane dipeptidase n=1 Tax=Lentzea sp. NPDC004782 TaxID=3154458 RepID=UPI0033B0B81B
MPITCFRSRAPTTSCRRTPTHRRDLRLPERHDGRLRGRRPRPVVRGHPRNKTDEELRLVADRGGFVGICFMPFPVLSGNAAATDDLDACRTHLTRQQAERASAGAAGESGTWPFVEDLRGVDQFRQLVRLLEEQGYREDRIAKIMGGNFLAYADRIWTA